MAKFVRSIDDIVGHKYIVKYLKSHLISNTVPQTILFNGSAGLGKTSLAKVLAVELNGNDEKQKVSVIDNNQSTDCIKLFNMSDVGDNTDEVVAELQSTGLSSTGLKVVILDEVHGMTKKAQDAILVTLEYLPKNLYVFMCTTDIGLLRESLISRCVVFNLNNLSFNEAKEVIKRCVMERKLHIGMSESVFLNLIAKWSENQPRKALNLLESFDEGSTVTQDDLRAFISVNDVSIVISIMEYMYGSLTKGIALLDSLTITEDFIKCLLDVLQVALGYDSAFVSQEDAQYINKFFTKYPIDNFYRFVIKVTSMPYVRKRNIIALFIENHSSMVTEESHKPSVDTKKAYLQDIKEIDNNPVELLKKEASLEYNNFENELEKAASIDALFDEAEVVNNG